MNNIGQLYKKHLAGRIILGVVAVILIVALAVTNYFLDFYSLILNRFFAGSTVDTGSEEMQLAFAEADEVVQEAAEESMVLLKNEGNYLPKDLAKVNLFGWGSTEYGFLLTGGGSGGTTITDTLKDGSSRIKVDLTDAFEAAGIEYNESLNAAYEKFSTYDADYRANGSTGADVSLSLKNPDESFYTQELMQQAKNFSDVAIVTISRWGAENGGSSELKKIGSYENGTYLELTAEERVIFEQLKNYEFEVVVLLNVCNNIELGFLDEYANIKACLFVGIPGQSGTMAIPRILTGEVNPSGRTSDTLAYDYNTGYDPTYANAVAVGDLVYQEGIYFGYKWYETAAADRFFEEHGTTYEEVVQFPFGFGLSYTTFEWHVVDWGVNETIDDYTKEYTVTVRVTNTGARAGKEVVQLYGHAPYESGKIEKAERVLLDFAKTPLLEANGGECNVTLSFSAYDLASYDAYDKNGNSFRGYELDKGNYELYLMDNAHDVHQEEDETFSKQFSMLQHAYDVDPVTNHAVENLFTGNTAYANSPVDGSSAYGGGVTYLSRANLFADFPTQARGTSNVTNKNDYRYTGYDTNEIASEVKTYQYGKNNGLYLVKAESDGSTVRATLAQLDGSSKDSVELVYDKDFMQALLNELEEGSNKIWNAFLNQFTKDDICNLIGQGGFQTYALESIGKPLVKDMDGPAGFNDNVNNPGKSSAYTLYPSESLLGCSWSRETGYAIGEAQGKIGTAGGINGWYGPGVNLHRSVFNSRNYEYYSEDGVLSGKIASATIQGAFDNNVYCYLKHFVASEAGQNPKMVNTWLTEQALREEYLKPFEIAVKNGANAVMSAFNNVGNVLSGYNHALLTTVLREEWGFKGSVITDWYEGSGYMSNHTLGVLAGNDLWLCGSASIPAQLDLKDPAVAYAARQSVQNILYTYITTNMTATGIKVNAEASSKTFAALWALIDVVLCLGILTCLTFVALPKWPARKNKVKVADGVETDESASEGEDKES